MCHLFAASASAPRTLGEFFPAFAPFAEKESPHGWGLAAYGAGATTLFKEPRSFAVAHRDGSPTVARAAKTSGTALLFHIRDASVGAHTLDNTHPFRRRVAGKTFLFAHHGTVPRVKERPLLRLERAGETDSEHAFLWMLEAMPATRPSLLTRWVRDAGNDLRALGKFNFILSEGDTIWALADTALWWCARSEPLASKYAAAPSRRSVARAARTLNTILVATCPFTADSGDSWRPLAPGALIVARRGRVVEIIE
jgi:glutamine amidotransferase